MEPLIIAVVAGLAALMTLYSGFGLGTVLMPVLAVFLPVETAVAATAMVHFANNIFKVLAVGRHADRDLVLRFGLPAVIAACAGAAALGLVAGMEAVVRYDLAGRPAVITPLKLLMALLMIAFALWELLPGLREQRFDRRYLMVGGLLSGFFGGLSGQQGALRSAFLVRTGIATAAFVGTNAWIGLLVDSSRLLVYAGWLFGGILPGDSDAVAPMVAAGMAGALVGVLVGKRFLRKITLGLVQTLTGVLLLVIALGLGSGIL
ncbi:MAG: TSUP family transporter [Magnetococcales bacterium]|nr:TSUP family transporter [Magnetococcales bacterium]